MPKIAIINVGANAASRALRSPIFKDSTFEFVPIELKTDNPVKGLDTFAEFKSFTGRPITDFIHTKFLSKLMHNDPEFITHTYGDILNPRSKNLNELYKSDTLYYLARLVEWNNGNWGKPGFYLVGSLVCDKLVRKSDLIDNQNLIQVVKNNAHVKSWLIKPEAESKNFWVLVGSDKSKRFIHAVPFDRNIVQKILLASDGKPIKWDSSKTDLQTIGSYTRACRIIDNPEYIKILEEHIKEYC